MLNHYRALLVNLLVISVVLVFMTIFFQRIEHLSAEAEQLSVQQFVVMVNAALTNQLLQAATQHELQNLPALAGTNPLQLLTQIPKIYRGEFSAPNLTEVQLGHWYFDPAQRVLIYRPVQNAHSQPPYLEYHYQVQFQYEDKNANQHFEWEQDRWLGLRLVALLAEDAE